LSYWATKEWWANNEPACTVSARHNSMEWKKSGFLDLVIACSLLEICCYLRAILNISVHCFRARLA